MYLFCWASILLVYMLEAMITKCCCIDNRKRNSLLKLGLKKAHDVLTQQEQLMIQSQLDAVEHPQTVVQSGTNASEQGGSGNTKVSCNKDEDKSKFMTRELITGLVKDAAAGIASFCVVSESHMSYITKNGIQAIEEEVAAYGNMDVSKSLHYILHEPAKEKKFSNGIRDKGQEGKRFVDFCKDPYSVEAGLRPAHVLALRLYTTAAYKDINGPLRKNLHPENRRPHPLPAVVVHIYEGIKRLRTVVANRQMEEMKRESSVSSVGTDLSMQITLWRGLKNVHVTRRFAIEGGTELAPMSTTTSLEVAIKYGVPKTKNGSSLLFKIKVANALKHGADLSWLSAFPGEAEVLYPPLTYLLPTGRMQELKSETSGRLITVIEMEPDLSA